MESEGVEDLGEVEEGSVGGEDERSFESNFKSALSSFF